MIEVHNPAEGLAQKAKAKRRDGHSYEIQNEVHFRLPEGSNRPYQMLAAQLVDPIIPAALIQTTTIEGEGSFQEFFSKYTDVTDLNLKPRSMSTVRAEFVALREIFCCDDRSFWPKEGQRYLERKPSVRGHNMDWVILDPGRDEVRAIHYDFEKFYKFVKWMDRMWTPPEGPQNIDNIKVHWKTELEHYIKDFGDDESFLEPLHSILTSFQKLFSEEYVAQCVSNMQTLHVRPDAQILHTALQGKIKWYLEMLEDFITDPNRPRSDMQDTESKSLPQ